MTRKFFITCGAIFFLTPVCVMCDAPTAATLKPAAMQDAGVYPYRNAVLKVNNNTGKSIVAVELRDSRGGPGMVFPTVIAPGSSGRVGVYLPAISLVQNYNIKLLRGNNIGDSPITVVKSQISWPPDMLTTDAFFDPQVYQRHEESAALWSNDIKLKAFVLLGIAAVGMSGVLLIRRTWLRVGLVVVVVVSACVADAVMRTQPFEIVTDPRGLIILSTRQTFCVGDEKSYDDSSQQKIMAVLRNSAPVYPGLWAYRDENMTVYHTGRFSFTLKPGELRVFRAMGILSRGKSVR